MLHAHPCIGTGTSAKTLVGLTVTGDSVGGNIPGIADPVPCPMARTLMPRRRSSRLTDFTIIYLVATEEAAVHELYTRCRCVRCLELHRDHACALSTCTTMLRSVPNTWLNLYAVRQAR
jgi:hypothetical protein